MIGPVNLNLRITNIGKAAASDVKVEFTVKGKNTVKRSWEQQLLGPNQFQDFYIPTSETEEELNLDYFEKNSTKIHLTATYKDILGNKHNIDEELNIEEFVSQFQRTKSAYLEDNMDSISLNLHSIYDELRNITRGTKTIGDSLTNRHQVDIVNYYFTIISREMESKKLYTNEELSLLLYSLENELKGLKRKDMIENILNQVEKIDSDFQKFVKDKISDMIK